MVKIEDQLVDDETSSKSKETKKVEDKTPLKSEKEDVALTEDLNEVSVEDDKTPPKSKETKKDKTPPKSKETKKDKTPPKSKETKKDKTPPKSKEEGEVLTEDLNEVSVEDDKSKLLEISDDLFIKGILPYSNLKDTISISQVSKRMLNLTQKDGIRKFILKPDGIKYKFSENIYYRITIDMSISIYYDTLKFIFGKPIECNPLTIYNELWIEESRNDIDNKQEYLWTFGNPPRNAIRKTCDIHLYHLFLNEEKTSGKKHWWYSNGKAFTIQSAVELLEKIKKYTSKE